jgi:hypothetical protein
MMEQRATWNIHLPPIRTRYIMTARDILYNDIRKYMHDQTVGFHDEHVDSLGDEFLKHLTYVVFPLSHSV